MEDIAQDAKANAAGVIHFCAGRCRTGLMFQGSSDR
jgi:hypothetical protein